MWYHLTQKVNLCITMPSFDQYNTYFFSPVLKKVSYLIYAILRNPVCHPNWCPFKPIFNQEDIPPY